MYITDTSTPAGRETRQGREDDTLTDTRPRPTKETYGRLQMAYEVFNKNLFDDGLPHCLITLQHRKRSYGYFRGDRFAREDGRKADEIALNPSCFRELPLIEALAILVHEMVHLWQHHHGKPGRGRYHNRQWAEKMKEVGLQPTATGAPGDAETGERMYHLVIREGPFARIAERLIGGGFVLAWTEQPSEQAEGGSRKTSKSGKRVRYDCPVTSCDQRAWAKHGARLACGAHMVPMKATDQS